MDKDCWELSNCSGKEGGDGIDTQRDKRLRDRAKSAM